MFCLLLMTCSQQLDDAKTQLFLSSGGFDPADSPDGQEDSPDEVRVRFFILQPSRYECRQMKVSFLLRLKLLDLLLQW